MDQAHPDAHREAFRETRKTIGLANGEYVTSGVFEPLRCAMHELAGESESLVSRRPTVNQRQRKHRQNGEAKSASQERCTTQGATLAVNPKRHALQLLKQSAQR